MFERCDPVRKPVPLSADRLRRVERSASLQPVRRRPVDAGLRVGPADDRYEHEADEMARTVVQALANDEPARVGGWRAVAFPSQPGATRIRRMTTATPIGPDGGSVDAETADAIAARMGRGQPMAPRVRRSMEHAFGTDFSRVRLHHGPDAADLSTRLGAEAFTVGSDVFFGRGLPDTTRTEGQGLLAHELAHTVQQARPAVVQRQPYGYDFQPDFFDPDPADVLVESHRKDLLIVQEWLDENDTSFAWLGLYDQDTQGSDLALSERIGWAKVHVPMWLSENLSPSPSERKVVLTTFFEGDAWLRTHGDAPFAKVDGTIDECRRLGLGWLADELTIKRDEIIGIVSSGKPGDGHQKKANLRAKSLNELAAPLDEVLAVMSTRSDEFDKLWIDIDEALDQIEDWTAAQGLKGRQGYIKEVNALRTQFDSIDLALGPPKTKGPAKTKGGNESQPPVAPVDRVQDLQRIASGAAQIVGKLKRLQPVVNELGERVQVAFESLPPSQQKQAQKAKSPREEAAWQSRKWKGKKGVYYGGPANALHVHDVGNDAFLKGPKGRKDFIKAGVVDVAVLADARASLKGHGLENDLHAAIDRALLEYKKPLDIY